MTAFTLLARDDSRHPIGAKHDVKKLGHDRRLAVARLQNIFVRGHDQARFGLRFLRERHVHGHLVAVEVGVEGGADQRVELDGVALDENRLEGLDAEAVKSRRAVQKHVFAVNYFFKDGPNFGNLVLDETAGSRDVISEFLLQELRDDEGLEEFKRHVLRQTALVKFEFRTDDDNRAAGVVHALAQKVLAEEAALALEVVGNGFERTALTLIACDRRVADGVVDESINGFLENSLLVSEDDIRSVDFLQFLQTVVPIYDTAVKVVDVGSGIAAAIERHHGADGRRNDRHADEEHPLGSDRGINHPLDGRDALVQARDFG